MAGAYRGEQPLDELAERGGLDGWLAQTQALAGVQPTDDDLAQAEWRIEGEHRRPTYARGAHGEVVALSTSEPAEVVPLDQRPYDEQRRVLHRRVGPEALAHLVAGGTLDAQQGRRIGPLPTGLGIGGQDVKQKRAIVEVDEGVWDQVELEPTIVAVDLPVGSTMTVEEIMAQEDQQRCDRLARAVGEDDGPADTVVDLSDRDSGGATRIEFTGTTERDLAKIAAGPKLPAGFKRRNDKGPRARSASGIAEPAASENWEHQRGVRTGKERPALVAARVTHESKAVLDADKTASNGEIMDAVGVLTQKTGWTKRQVLDHLERAGETGCFDPAIVDAMPARPASSVA
jgi:hypothetical protein